MRSHVVVLGGICPSPLMSCMYCTFDVLYIYIYLRLRFAIACLAYNTAIKFALYQPLYPEFIVNSFDIKRAAATFVQFACTLHGKHKCSLVAAECLALSERFHKLIVNCATRRHICVCWLGRMLARMLPSTVRGSKAQTYTHNDRHI